MPHPGLQRGPPDAARSKVWIVGDLNMPERTAALLRQFYDSLHGAYGPQGWWPGETPTEVAIGAILVQNTNWQNVEKAIARLRAAEMLDWRTLSDLPTDELAELIRPAGYYQVKARRLKNLVKWLCEEHAGDLERLRSSARSVEAIREELLGVNGIGPETADSIVLYALNLPTFVVDAYTARIVGRHGLIGPEAVDYAELKALFEDHMPQDPQLFKEYHALLVAVGKKHCLPQPRCAGCPLECYPRITFDE